MISYSLQVCVSCVYCVCDAADGVTSSGRFNDPLGMYRLRHMTGLSQDVFELAAAGLTRPLREELSARPSRVNEASSADQLTCIMAAAREGHIDTVNMLLDLKADINIKNKY